MTRTAAHFGIHKSTVSHWVASWQIHGIDGITWKIAGYSPAFKLEVVKTTQKEHPPDSVSRPAEDLSHDEC
nr:helix-turn-helix domain-containing protein [Buttiauxella sp. B2]